MNIIFKLKNKIVKKFRTSTISITPPQKKYYIWGTKSNAVLINQYCTEQLDLIHILGYICDDSSLWGKQFYGKPVYSPYILSKNRENYIIIVDDAPKALQKIKKKYPWCIDKTLDLHFIQKLQIQTRYADNKDKDIQQILNYLSDHSLEVFNYPFREEYRKRNWYVEYDTQRNLYYTIHNKKKLYFSRSFATEYQVKKYYRSICMEQDIHSPHNYLTDEFNVSDGAVVIDAGVAEGNFALSIIDRISKIYLFEPDRDWIEALEYTFEPYKDKVVIINKCLSNYIDSTTTTVDTVMNGLNVDFIKMDIEGEEFYALQGAEKTIQKSDGIKCAICTYHQEFAYDAISNLLKEYQFDVTTSDGYMWYYDSFNAMRAPVLRKGVIRATKRLK